MLGEGPERQRMVDIALGGGRKEFLPKPYALKIGHILAYLGHILRDFGIFDGYFRHRNPPTPPTHRSFPGPDEPDCALVSLLGCPNLAKYGQISPNFSVTSRLSPPIPCRARRVQGEEAHNGSRVDGIDLIARFTDGGGKYSWSKDCTEGAEDRDAAGDDSCVPLKEAIDSAIRIPSHAQVKMPTASPPFPTASPPF